MERLRICNTEGAGGMIKIYFVRHAQPVSPWPDDRTKPLTEQGLADRQVVMDVMGDIPVDAVYCSTYRRSIETIEAFAASRGLEIVTEERLRERKAGPDSWSHLVRRWADFSHSEDYGECLRSVQNRNIEVIHKLLDKHAGQTLLIGTHGTALSTILHYFDATFGEKDSWRFLNSLPYIIRLDFEGRQCVGKEELHWNERGYTAHSNVPRNV